MCFSTAIRHDRTRGGRSSYGGSSPFEEPKKKRPAKPPPQRRQSNPTQVESSTLVSVLSGSSPKPDRPFVPQILSDIMNLESLLSDDDIPANISVDDFSLSNPNVFMTLLQLCELKLYKIVRWARNLPYFANISVSWVCISCNLYLHYLLKLLHRELAKFSIVFKMTLTHRESPLNGLDPHIITFE